MATALTTRRRAGASRRTLAGSLVLAGSLALLLLTPETGLAQCSMCRTALEQNPDAAAGFNRAILFLLAAPYAVFGSLAAYFAISRRRRRNAALLLAGR